MRLCNCLFLLQVLHTSFLHLSTHLADSNYYCDVWRVIFYFPRFFYIRYLEFCKEDWSPLLPLFILFSHVYTYGLMDIYSPGCNPKSSSLILWLQWFQPCPLGALLRGLPDLILPFFSNSSLLPGTPHIFPTLLENQPLLQGVLVTISREGGGLQTTACSLLLRGGPPRTPRRRMISTSSRGCWKKKKNTPRILPVSHKA